MELIVKLGAEAAAALRAHQAHPVTAMTEAILEPLDLRLRPLHANRPTGRLSTYFVVDAPDNSAEMLRSRLSSTPGVEAAYVAPSPEPA
jgi:hypothetical protein